MSSFSLTRISTPADPLADVVFVHGLFGSPVDTWTNPRGESWANWLTEEHPDLAVYSFGYPAEGTKWTTKGSGMDIREVSRTAAAYLFERGLLVRPTIWVTHSLGGLLVKQMLRNHDLGDTALKGAWKWTRAVTFLATPHRGSDLAAVVRRLHLLFQANPNCARS